MNDQSNIYIALKFRRTALDVASSLAVDLDTNGSGVTDVGDDAFIFNPNPAVGFQDLYHTLCSDGVSVCSVYDTTLGGTNDGAGAVANDGTYTTFELRHPYNSGDAYDVALHRGDSIGFIVHLRLLDGSGNLADTHFPSTNLYLSKLRIK